MPRPKKNASCHPAEPHVARGLCSKCYGRARTPNYSPETLAKRAEYNREYQRRLREEAPERLAEQRARKDRKKANESSLRWRQANPERVKAGRHAMQLKRYRLTVAQYEALFAAQRGGCAICRGDNDGRRLAVDHCHETGAVRGLLCSGCNFAVGWAERRGESVLGALLKYLRNAIAIKREAA